MVKDAIKVNMGIVDSQTGKRIFADKIIDISEHCPEAAQCVIKYGNAKRGRIAQICEFYQKNIDLGSTVHFFTTDETQQSVVKNNWFELRAKVSGIKPELLAKLIYENDSI